MERCGKVNSALWNGIIEVGRESKPQNRANNRQKPYLNNPKHSENPSFLSELRSAINTFYA